MTHTHLRHPSVPRQRSFALVRERMADVGSDLWTWLEARPDATWKQLADELGLVPIHLIWTTVEDAPTFERGFAEHLLREFHEELPDGWQLEGDWTRTRALVSAMSNFGWPLRQVQRLTALLDERPGWKPKRATDFLPLIREAGGIDAIGPSALCLEGSSDLHLTNPREDAGWWTAEVRPDGRHGDLDPRGVRTVRYADGRTARLREAPVFEEGSVRWRLAVSHSADSSPTMVPDVRREHVLAALRRIDRDGVPPRRQARGYELVHDGRRYPPKYALALAIELATGTFPDSESFGGGAETNGVLKRLGFTVVKKGAPVPSPTASAGVVLANGKVRVGRIFLDLGMRQDAYRALPEGKAAAFHRIAQEQFASNPSRYRDRIVALVERARDEGASVVVLPAFAFQVSRAVKLGAYAVPDVPLVVAGGVDHGLECAWVIRHGVAGERFDWTTVQWMDAGDVSVMAAISSTIGKAIETRFEPPVESADHPPDPSKPVLVVDVGHAQYSGHYYRNTLRCVARDVAARTRQPAALVLSSWMWSTRGVGERWTQPPERFGDVQRIEVGGDYLDVFDVDLG